MLALWGALAGGCAAKMAKTKASSDDLPLIDANKMKKIEVIHLTPEDERQSDAAKVGGVGGDPKEASADTPAGKSISTRDVAADDSVTLPEPGSASQTTPTSTDKAGKEAAPTKPAGPVIVVTMPGFRVFSDGSSRVYVRVSGRTKIVEKKGEGKLRYHLSGVTVPERVNRMALPTGHFGTPVAKAFVAQVEGGADLVIVLRETVKGVVRLKKRGRGVVLSVDFPKQRKKAEEEKDPLADAG